MPISNFPKGFQQGFSVQGMPLAMTFATGQRALGSSDSSGVWWVDSANGLDGNKGTYQLPLKTLGRAMALVTAGDIIMIKPGHSESISSSTAASGAWNVAGVQIIGLGVGSQRPTFTLDTANTSTINVSAANISVSNCIFVANFLNVAALFTLTTAKGFSVQNCFIYDTSAILNFLIVVKSSATTNANDQLVFNNNQVNLLATSGVVNLAAVTGTHDSWTITNNVYTATTTGTGAVIPITAGKILTNFLMMNNLFNIQNAAGTATGYLITTNGTTNTGFIHNNFDHALPTTPLPITLTSGFVYGLNYHSDQNDLAGYLVPAADV